MADPEDGSGPQPGGPGARSVTDQDVTDGRPTAQLPAGRDGAKAHPDNVRWLRSRLGAGPLSWVLMRGPIVVRVTGLEEDGYIAPRGEGDQNGPATIAKLTGAELSTRLMDHYEFVVARKDGETSKEWFPRSDCQRALDTPEQLPYLRQLRGVTHTPMLRADGTILDTPGYDDASGFLYLPDVAVAPIPDRPSEAELSAAVTLLRGLVDEFVWAGEHDEANFLGALLTPVLRELCPPPYKLVGIMARQPGSGKSLLNRILRELHGGVFRAEMPHDDAELEKAISAILTCTTAPVVQFDNVSGTLRSSRLAALLTSPNYSGRLLGSTNNVDMVNDRLWTITGNNLNLGGDLVRRTLWVTIDPKVPNPERRTNFRLDLTSYVREHRGELLHALLVLVRAWVVGGKPALKTTSDDYAHWTATVRAILAHAGVPGEFDHDDSAQQKVGADDEGWGEFLEVVYTLKGSTAWLARDLVDLMENAITGRDLAEALPAELHEKYVRNGAAAIARSLGMWLKNRNGRFAGGLVCELVTTDSHSKARLWAVRRAGDLR